MGYSINYFFFQWKESEKKKKKEKGVCTCGYPLYLSFVKKKFIL